MRDSFRVLDGHQLGLEDHRAATVAGERRHIDEERALVSSYPILDSGYDSGSDDREVPGVTHQAEGEADQEYAITLDRLVPLSETSADVADEYLSARKLPPLQQRTGIRQRRDSYVRTIRMGCPRVRGNGTDGLYRQAGFGVIEADMRDSAIRHMAVGDQIPTVRCAIRGTEKRVSVQESRAAVPKGLLQRPQGNDGVQVPRWNKCHIAIHPCVEPSNLTRRAK